MDRYSPIKSSFSDFENSFSKFRISIKSAAADAYLEGETDLFRSLDSLLSQASSLDIDDLRSKIKNLGTESNDAKLAASEKYGNPHPIDFYEKPFLDLLRQKGGELRLKDILVELERELSPKFSALDRSCDTPSDPERPRWKAQIYSLTNSLVEKGAVSRPRKGWYRLEGVK